MQQTTTATKPPVFPSNPPKDFNDWMNYVTTSIKR